VPKVTITAEMALRSPSASDCAAIELSYRYMALNSCSPPMKTMCDFLLFSRQVGSSFFPKPQLPNHEPSWW
jgi:hypothetical protein